MRKIYVVALSFTAFALSLSLQAQDAKSLDTKYGFKNFKLGSKYTPVFGVKSKDDSGAEKVVISRTDEKIGDIPVKSIELYYINDSLARIDVKVSPENHAKLLEACKGSFGSPGESTSDNEETRKIKNENLTTGKYYKNQYKWKANKVNLEYFYQYPIVSGDPYSLTELYLAYSLKDYATRLKNAKKSGYTAKDF
jgi:hypothetical protein